MRRRRLSFIAIAAVGLTAALVGCGSSQSDTQATGGVSGLATQQQQQRIDLIRLAGGLWGYPTPFLFKSGAGNALNSFVYDTLAWKDKNGNFIPLLATSWKPVQNGSAWDIQLHKNVKWSDGQDFSAQDVAFTFQYMTQGAGKNTGDAFGHAVTGWQVVNHDEVILSTGQPFGGFNEMILGLVHILPQHVWQNVTDVAKFNGPDAFIGTGPYNLESADPTTGTYSFTARDNYYLGAPLVKRVEFVPATDPLLALRRNEIDMAQVPNGTAQASLDLISGGDFSLIKGRGVAVTSLYFNFDKGFPYTDVNFRQAIATGIDRQEIINRALFGNGELGSYGGLPAGDVWTAKDLPTYPYDQEKARGLLDKAGLKLVNGVRTLPNGQAFNPTIVLGSTFNTTVASMVKEYLLALGINATFQTLDATSASKAQADGRYDMALLTTGPGVDPIDLSRMFMPNPVPGSWTVHGYHNLQYDQLWAQQKATADQTQRMAIVRQMEMITANDVAKIDIMCPYPMASFRKSAGLTWYWVPAGTLDGYGGILNKYILALGK